MMRSAGIAEPELPPGRAVELPGRGTTFIREIEGPTPEAPTVLLLHGWTASSDVNWFLSYGPLAEHFRVVAMDHHGHGAGIRRRRAFRLAECADDAASLIETLGVGPVIAVGYSMGGPIAQLLWRQHRHLVCGLVLCATTSTFSAGRQERMTFMGLTALAAIARFMPSTMRVWLTHRIYLQRKAGQWEPWALEQAARHEWRTVLEAGQAIGHFSSTSWIGQVDVPTSVIITMRDRVVPTHRQIAMYAAIRGAIAYRVDGDHDACIANADVFVPTLVRAVTSVCDRVETVG